MNRRAFLTTLAAGFVAPFLPVPAPKYAAGTWGALERSSLAFWRAELVPATGCLPFGLVEGWAAAMARDIDERSAALVWARLDAARESRVPST